VTLSPRGAGGLVAAAVMALPCAALAQSHESAARIDQLQPASAGSPFTRAEGPREEAADTVSYAARLIVDYALGPLKTKVVGGTPDVAGETSDKFPVKHAILMHAGARVSPVHWFDVELNMPFAVFERGDADNSTKGEPVAAGVAGVGDLRFGLHARPYTSKPFSFQLGGRVWAPTGSAAAYMNSGSRALRFEALLSAAGTAADKDFLAYGCTLGIAPLFFAGRDGDRFAVSCAAALRPRDFVQIGLEPHVAVFAFRNAGEADPDQRLVESPGLGSSSLRVQFEPLASLTFHVSDVWITLAGGPGIGNAPGTGAARGLLSVTYAGESKRVVVVPKVDSDGDGIPDDQDDCPKEAGVKETNGCPEKVSAPDRDGDGIPDEQDACIDKPGIPAADKLANGCPDSDNDHFPDSVDECPNEPGEGNDDCPKVARLKGKEFVSTPPIGFDGGGAHLGAKAQKGLVEIVRTTRANPKIAHLTIKLGTKGASNALTDARAKAILGVLADQNFESSRYELVLADDLASGSVQVLVR
jgi:hypothetical protein